MPDYDSGRSDTMLLERVLHALGAVGDFQICMAISFAGRVDAELLKRAMNLCFDTVPHLKSRFRSGRFGATWERIDDIGYKDFFRQKETESPEADVLSYFSDPIDHLRGPQVKALLLSGDQDTLCLKTAHHAADAGGVKEYAYLLSEYYRELGNDAGFKPDKPLGSRCLDQVTSQFPRGKYLGMLRATARDLLSHPPFPRPVSLPGEPADLSGRAYRIHHIESDLFRSLTAWTRSHGFTINDALMAASLRALTKANSGRSGRAHRLVVTADLRRYLPADAAPVIGNLSGWVLPSLGGDLGKTFLDTCVKTHNCMSVRKADYLGLGMLPPLTALDKLLPLSWMTKGFAIGAAVTSKLILTAPSFTNMGIIDPKRLDFGSPQVTNAFLVPPIVYPPIFGFGASGFSETLTFSCGFCSPGFDTEAVETFFHDLESELEKAC